MKTLPLPSVFIGIHLYTKLINMIKPYKPLLLSFLCLFMGGCDMIDYHPYDVRISGETDVNAHNIAENN